MMIHHFRRALQDIFNHRYLNAVTIITIGLSILIASAFVLFFMNANDIINSWKQGLRIMVYIKPGVDEKGLSELKQKIQSLPQVQTFTYIPKDEALNRLKQQMRRQSSLFDHLKENPLPDAFELQVLPPANHLEDIERIAEKIEALKSVDEVEYGQRWLGQFSHIVHLFRLAGYTLAGLFFMAALFIVANTSRLILYSRREEIEVMRLVGATDGFIKAPFYIQGVIQGAVGGLGGLAALLVTFIVVSSNIGYGLTTHMAGVRFLSPLLSIGIVFCSMLVGWLGCYLSLKQFLKS